MTDLVDVATEVRHTTCTLDCPDTCSLAVTVELDPTTRRAVRIVDIDAAPGNPLTDGWICAKVKRHGERVHGPSRVLTPLVRTGPKGSGTFRAATWDEALSTIAARLRATLERRGADAVVAFTYNSSAGVVERASLSEALFAHLGAAQVEHTICAHTMGLAWDSVYGDLPSTDPRTVVDSRLVVVWGANPTVSNTHFPPLVRQAVRKGAKVAVIDPRRAAMAARADLHLAVRPGTDVALAHAIAGHWHRTGRIDLEAARAMADGVDEFLAESDRWTIEHAAEVCGLDPADVVTLADWWADIRPAMLRIGWGTERNANGGAGCRAVLALPVLAGQFGVPGGGLIGSTGTAEVAPRRRWPAIDRPDRRVLPLHQVGAWMAPDSGDPVEVLFVQGANPVVMCPDQRAVVRAFERDDVFTVVHEQVLTDTARYADVVLPATTAFEIADVAGSYGSFTVQPVRPVIDRVGESRSNDEVGLALAHALGLAWSAAPVDVAVADAGPRTVATGVPFVDVRPFDGRARLVDPDHGVPTYRPVPADRPLVLISPASSKLINSMFGEFQSPSPAVLLHPDDAAARGLTAGQQVRVQSAVGEIVVPLEVGAEIRPGVALMSKGVWLHHHADGWGVNALTPATGDPLGNGACFNDTFVEVTAAD